ncbi:hypothetical protein BGW38_005523 [Lunasporangiospora selenospora]|uniref:Uncharacterized protein n=1 Tax=Lunasporangiospora selenospora TaxID=979761 RepID=A0A9P6KIM9_9FUNG|nr:hypothetical protein BGW38_005523 [Lunasporangiospora selenospora]
MEIDLMRDLQELLSNREASFVGLDWHLPKLREIKLSFEGSIMIGTFDQCPLLESLWIESDTTDFQYSGYYSSMSAIHWKAYSSLLSLLPIWNLPRLEKLHLSGLPSALFNFESIRSMGRLKELVLDMNIRGWASGFADMYMKLYADILESSFRKRVNAPGQDSVPRFHPWNWSSESLSSIFIKGPAAFMFHLEQLVQFPSLERLELAPPTNDTYSFMNKEDDVLGMLYSCNTLDPLDSSFDMGKIMDRVDPPLPLSKTWTQTQPGEPATLPRVRIQDGKDVYGLSTSRFIRLSSASKLRTVRFSGRWDALGPNSWMQVLTNYAPNISELHGFSTVDPIGQIRGIELAFTAMKKMNSIYDRVKGEMKQASDGLHSNDVCRQGRKPRSGLHAVFTTGVLSEVDQMKLGLEMIVESDVEYYAARPNGRIYEFRQDQSFFVPT